ncbi:hypothetical protein OSTOST_00442, partial [Ostertagia ostertagi]
MAEDDCTSDLKSVKDQADEKVAAFASYTQSGKQCNNDGDCRTAGKGGICVNVKDQGKPIDPLKPGTSARLCCSYSAKNDSEVYLCETGKAIPKAGGGHLECGNDEDCNRVEGTVLAAKEKWEAECVVNEKFKKKYCCP